MNSLVPNDSQEILDRLQQVSEEMDVELADLITEDANFEPVVGEWSIKDIVCHLRDAEQIWKQRVTRILEEDEPFLRAFNPDELATEHDYPSQDWNKAKEDYQYARQVNLDLFKSLEPAQWLKGGIHQERGHVTIRELIESLFTHTQEHLEQIRHARWLAK